MTIFVMMISSVFSPLAKAIKSDKATVYKSNTYQAKDYFSRPTLPETLSQKIMLVHIDQSIDMLERAYSSIRFNADRGDGLEGHFTANKQYRYRHKEQYFEQDDALKSGQKDAWDGQFLNWLSMRKLDMAHLLILGLSEQKSSEIVSLASNGHQATATIRDSHSRHYSPIPNFMPITLSSGKLEYQGKSLRLRIKQARIEKGLIDLISPSIKLYFHSHKALTASGKRKQVFSFGTQDKLTEFLTNWNPSKEKLTKSQYHQAALNSFQRALENIKVQSLNLKNKSDTLCQQYTHLLIPHSIYGSFSFNEKLLNDCQARLKTTQASSSFKWGVIEKTNNKFKGVNNSLERIKFTYSEKDSLFRVMFDRLFYESQSHAYVVNGAEMESFSNGTALLYQSLSRYLLKSGAEQVNWLGDLRASLIDDQGRLRSDNGDKKLGSLNEDPLVFSCFDERDKQLRFQFSNKTFNQSNPKDKCTRFRYPYLDKDVGYLWKASESFSNLHEDDITQQRYPFHRSGDKRYIRTNIGCKEYDFVAGKGYPLKPEWLNMRSQQDLDDLINYVRGQDQENHRHRRIDSHRFLLGDIDILGALKSSAPVVVSQPRANYHLLYNDDSYREFLKQYQHRRARVFISSNDGLLHSFNAGWYDVEKNQLQAAQKNLSKWRLGQEIWAFVPEPVLPHLNELSHESYGISPEHHLTLVNQSLYVFDAKVFGDNGIKGQSDRVFQDENGQHLSGVTHPEGWGTIMFVGVGLGNVDLKKAGLIDKVSEAFKPSYLIFDITDAEQAPKLLASIRAPAMGSAMSLPSVMTQRNQQGEIDWHLVIGSGADLDPMSVKSLSSSRTAGIYIYDLKNIDTKAPLIKANYIDLKEPFSYVAGISSADWDLDGASDALYVNTGKNSSRKTGGRLYRINTQSQHSTSSFMQAEKLLQTKLPLKSRPQLSLDGLGNRWIYTMTSQILTESSLAQSSHKIFGIKEPRDSKGNFLVESISGRSGMIPERSLLDVSDILVSADKGILSGSWYIQPALKEPTVLALERRMMSYSNAQDAVSGWLLRLDQHEVPNGSSKLFGGILSQATYQASYSDSQPSTRQSSIHHLSSKSYIRKLRFTTGTAWFDKVNDADIRSKKTATLQDTKGRYSGSTMVSAILLHSQNESVRQIQSSSDGNIQTTEESGRDIPISAETSWREL